MISKLNNLFKKSDFDERNEFRNRVLKLLQEMYPNLPFELDEDLAIIRSGEITLGLTNLYSKFLLTSQTNFELKELMKEHFAGLLLINEMVERKQNETWEKVKTLVMPQLMPADYVNKMPVVNYPFGGKICVGIVVDDENSYAYVTDNDLEKWDIGEDELYQTAIDNLTEKSTALEMAIVPGPNGIVVVNTMDSFDAVRILLPHLQEFFADKLGNAFYFGVPNRDFLICWSKESDKDFQQSMRQQIASDFEERPYPLSRLAFEMDENRKIKQHFSPGDVLGKAKPWMSNN